MCEGTRRRLVPLLVKGESAGSYWTPNVDAMRLLDWPRAADEEDDVVGAIIAERALSVLMVRGFQ